MNLTQTKHSFAIAALSAAVAFVSPVIANEASQAELEEVKTAFVSIKSKLENIQSQALEKDSVQKAIADEEATLKTELLEASPEEKDTIDAYFNARKKLTDALQKQSAEDVDRLKTELAEFSSVLETGLQEAASSPEVKAAKQETEKAILLAMNEIEPKTLDLLKEQAQLYRRYRELLEQS